MFNAARLSKLKPTAYLINTARGGIVDEAALHAALTTGQARRRRPRRVRSGAAADRTIRCSSCRTSSPPRISPASPARRTDRMSLQTAKNILSVFDGDIIRDNVVNKEALG